MRSVDGNPSGKLTISDPSAVGVGEGAVLVVVGEVPNGGEG